jgi:hypothetical protein
LRIQSEPSAKANRLRRAARRELRRDATGRTVQPHDQPSLTATQTESPTILRLIRLDPSSNSIVDSSDIGPVARPTGGPWFTVAAGSIWLSDSNSDCVLRLSLTR